MPAGCSEAVSLIQVDTASGEPMSRVLKLTSELVSGALEVGFRSDEIKEQV
jgi:hypothetical protein